MIEKNGIYQHHRAETDIDRSWSNICPSTKFTWKMLWRS